MDEHPVGKEVVDATIALHREFGPELLEAAHEVVLLDEFIQGRADLVIRLAPIVGEVVAECLAGFEEG